MTVYRREVHESPVPRVFVRFRRWPLVPSAELYRLQTILSQCVELAGSDSANELLTLVTDELERRTAETNLPHRSVRAVHSGTHGSRRRPGHA
ncbi:hypothetical protein [Arthrobacter sp. 92]|uniref:hypothetical protein n=1 Tax=Arthrobacter sp. 92 TaxID=3418175 RepID=UPI003D05992F